MHEEDFGLLWKHVDYRTEHNESRRARRLVLSFLTTVVNYDKCGANSSSSNVQKLASTHHSPPHHMHFQTTQYLHYFYFYQDGTIEYEVRAVMDDADVLPLNQTKITDSKTPIHQSKHPNPNQNRSS